MLKPQDVVVAVKLALSRPWPTYVVLGKELQISPSEAHAAVRRLVEARLVDSFAQTVRRDALRNFIVHGVPYVFPAYPMEVTRGIPTAWAADVVRDKVPAPEHTLPPVWPDPDGPVKGAAVIPLYPTLPKVVQQDPVLHPYIALIDAVRMGRAPQRAAAVHELDERFSQIDTAEESLAH